MSGDDPFIRGVHLHNAGNYFAAHEEWEVLWRRETDAEARRLLQGLIQITAAFHKLFVMRNAASAAKLLARGSSKLDRAPDTHRGIDLKQFRSDVALCEERFIVGIRAQARNHFTFNRGEPLLELF